MEIIIFLLIIATAVARSKNGKNKKSAQEKEQERWRRIQSAWDDAWDKYGTAEDEGDKSHTAFPGESAAGKGSYAPRNEATKPAAAPLQERKSAYTPVSTAGPAATVKERTKAAATTALKEMQNTVKGSMDFDSSEGEASKEGKSRYRQRHVVKPFTETTHLHTESSITGTVPCPPDRDVYAPAVPQPAAAAPAADITGSLTGEELRRAVIYSEILGKPKGRR